MFFNRTQEKDGRSSSGLTRDATDFTSRGVKNAQTELIQCKQELGVRNADENKELIFPSASDAPGSALRVARELT